MKCFKIFILCSTLSLSAFQICVAKDLFVSLDGNDSVSYDNNDITHPWRSVSKAWNDARTDDVVYYRAGDYTISSPINVADGGHNVTHMNYNNETVSWSSTMAAAVIEVGEPNITIDGIDVNSNTSDGDDGFFRLGWNNNGSSPPGFTLRNFTGRTTGAGQNTGIVHMRYTGGQYAEGALIENCRLIGPGSEVGTSNTSGIIMFEAHNWIIRNCEISDFYTAIYYNKHPNDKSARGGEIRNNYIHDSHNGLWTQANYLHVVNNVITSPVKLGYASGATSTGDMGSDYNTFEHNTILAQITIEDKTGSGDDLVGAQYNNFINNIITQRKLLFPWSSRSHNTSSNYNLYATGDILLNNSSGYSLSEWRVHNNSDTQSLSGTPEFVGGTSPSTIEGFALSTSSIGYRAASDGYDMGADTSLVGIGGSDDPIVDPEPSPISPVSDFRLVGAEQPPVYSSNECINYSNLHPDWIFCDDFESEDTLVGVGRYFQYADDEGDFTPLPNIGVDGSRGMQVLWQTGEIDAGNFALGFGRNPSSYMDQGIHSNDTFREIYYRMYMKTEYGWEGNPYKLSRASVISGNDWTQAMIAHLWISNSEDDSLAVDPVSCVDNGVVQCSGWNDFNNMQWLGQSSGNSSIYSTQNSDQWRCIEVHVKLNDPGQSNGVHEFWIDGDLQASRSNLNFTDTYTDYGINYIAFENYWNGGSPKEQSRYFDNIVVATEPIGCN